MLLECSVLRVKSFLTISATACIIYTVDVESTHSIRTAGHYQLDSLYSNLCDWYITTCSPNPLQTDLWRDQLWSHHAPLSLSPAPLYGQHYAMHVRGTTPAQSTACYLSVCTSICSLHKHIAFCIWSVNCGVEISAIHSWFAKMLGQRHRALPSRLVVCQV